MPETCDRTVVRRAPEGTLLHSIVRRHLEAFLAEVRRRGDGRGLPAFVERELREFVSCGTMARGFARFQCNGCRREILVAFSCKGRGFCPSCCGRRMCERAAHLVDGVFEAAPVRQWVLTLPHRLRYRLAYDHRLCRAVLGVYARTLLSFQRRLAREQGVVGRAGAVTAIQRCGSALNMNIHFHTLVAEGVFEGGIESPLRFVASLRPPSHVEVARLLAAVRRRIIRLVRKHGIELEEREGEGGDGIDPLFEEQPALATIQGASVLGRVVTGPRAGRWVVRLGRDRRADVVISGGRRQAHMRGFDLHADTAVGEGERDRLERLCRYVLRPPLAGDALEMSEDGSLLLRLRRRWRDGTEAIRFEPSELLERLAAMIPRPRANQLMYHGAYAPRGVKHERAWSAGASSPAHGQWDRGRTELEGLVDDLSGLDVPRGPSAENPIARVTGGAGGEGRSNSGSAGAAAARPPPERECGYVRPRHHAWADLLRRTFAVDVLDCPECGGRLRLLATIAQREVIERILAHLGLPTDPVTPQPARPEEELFV